MPLSDLFKVLFAHVMSIVLLQIALKQSIIDACYGFGPMFLRAGKRVNFFANELTNDSAKGPHPNKMA